MKRWELRGNPENVKIILDLHSTGRTNVAIANVLGCSPSGVQSFLESQGIVPNLRIYREIELVGDGSAKCSKCEIIKPLDEWSRRQDGSPKLTYCKKCQNAQGYALKNASPLSKLHNLLIGVRFRCRKNNIPYDLTSPHLFYLWEMQQGKCFYTDVTLSLMKGEGRNQNGVSLDRVDSEEGYLMRNIVLTSFRINSVKRDLSLDEMKMWMPDWHRRAVNFLKDKKEAS